MKPLNTLIKRLREWCGCGFDGHSDKELLKATEGTYGRICIELGIKLEKTEKELLDKIFKSNK